MCTCNHAVNRGVLGHIWAFKLTVFLDSALIWFHHDRIEIDISISVTVVSLTTWEVGFALGLWWASQVVNETTMTSILESIHILYNVDTLLLPHPCSLYNTIFNNIYSRVCNNTTIYTSQTITICSPLSVNTTKIWRDFCDHMSSICALNFAIHMIYSVLCHIQLILLYSLIMSKRLIHVF